jgi:uncharacterized membrane protein
MNSRSVRVLVIVSVLLNVFLIGGIVGGGYRWVAAQRSVAAQQARPLRSAANGLSQERQQQFVDDLRQARRDGRMLAQDSREGRLDVAQALAAPQFDPAAVDAALARTRNADMALRIRVEQTIATFAASLSPEERVIFADGLKHDGLLRVAPAPPVKK